jgi:hypothetical protein
VGPKKYEKFVRKKPFKLHWDADAINWEISIGVEVRPVEDIRMIITFFFLSWHVNFNSRATNATVH